MRAVELHDSDSTLEYGELTYGELMRQESDGGLVNLMTMRQGDHQRIVLRWLCCNCCERHRKLTEKERAFVESYHSFTWGVSF